MTDLAERTDLKAPQESGGSELTRVLAAFLNDQWKDELGIKAKINTAHPEAEMDCYRMHEINMLRYEQLFTILYHAEKYRKALELVQAWGAWSPEGIIPKGWPTENGKPLSPAEIINDALCT